MILSRATPLLISIALLANLCTTVAGKKLTRVKPVQTYKNKDDLNIIVNSVGPFNNPVEKYRFYSLPFCHVHDNTDGFKLDNKRNKGAIPHKQRLGEHLAGDHRESSPYAVQFKENIENRVLCKVKLDQAQLKQFKDSIMNSYYFEMYVHDLAMWGYVGDIVDEDLMGETGAAKTYLFPHHHFKFGVNKDKVVTATISTDVSKKVDITNVNEPKEVEFTYSVEFHEETLQWKDRLTQYSESRFVPSTFEIHWLSIINSFVLVLLLTAFLAVILMRVLKNDFSKYMELDEESMEEEESGWKLIHGDVFRFPAKSCLFCASVGTGTQLLVANFFILLLALTGMISMTRRGSILASTVVIYCLTSVIGGYVSTNLYLQMNGKAWARCVLLTGVLFPLPVVTVFSWANSIAILHGSTSALPFGVIFTMAALYIFICAPLTLVGGVLAKNFGSKDMKAPTRTTRVAREIPTEVPWYKGRVPQMFIAGFLPFSAIYIELHYIFASMWGHQVYTLFGILFFAFILLVIVTSSITVSLLYFQLSREDHRWWWISFANGGMIGFFIYAYSFYFYFHRSGMNGLLQTSFYFGYMGIISFATFLMLGSAGFRLSLVFVKYIYGSIKCE
mmetsp:Transcript_16021/g.18966  ORF Transcript_16021/g.18966 Transcript_16021/m.18966 type:complete len:617 (-) Transcript_16021:384-2234(-)